MARKLLTRAQLLKPAKKGRLTAAQSRRLNANLVGWLRDLASAIEDRAILETARTEHRAFQRAVEELAKGHDGPEALHLAFTAGERYAELQLAIDAEKGLRASNRASERIRERTAKANARHDEMIRYAKAILPNHRRDNGKVYKEEIYRIVADVFLVDERTAGDALRPWLKTIS